MQVTLAYVNVIHDSGRTYSSDISLNGPPPTSAHSAFPNLFLVHSRGRSRSQHRLDSPNKSSKNVTKFFHVYLDLRAFVASPCSPGETAELFFSLYRKQGTQFITEEFCAILSHNGVLARDPSSRIRTMFTDLVLTDVQDPIYLVCRIVRNGILKSGSESFTRASDSVRSDGNMSTQWVDAASPSTAARGSQSNESLLRIRRPFGCAVLELSQLSKMVEDQLDVSPFKEYIMPIYSPTNEISFSMIHQSIINNNTKEYEKSSRFVAIDFLI